MQFMWQFIGVVFGMAGAMLALAIGVIVLYIVIVAVQTVIEDRKTKGTKKNGKR